MSTTNIIIPERTNDAAALGLSSFIHALFELECYAVARLVAKENKPPLMVLLCPSIEPDYECLLEVQLPFTEDVRTYRFPPLDKVITVSGKVVTEHRNLPNDDLLNAMSKYVDSMELVDEDEDGCVDLVLCELGWANICRKPVETFPIEDAFSPILHRIDSAIRFRATHPNEPLPPPADILTKFSQPPADAVQRAKKYLDRLADAADVKKGQLLTVRLSMHILTTLQYHPRQRDASAPAKLKSRSLVLMSTLYCIKRSALRSHLQMPFQNSSKRCRTQRTSTPSARP